MPIKILNIFQSESHLDLTNFSTRLNTISIWIWKVNFTDFIINRSLVLIGFSRNLINGRSFSEWRMINSTCAGVMKVKLQTGALDLKNFRFWGKWNDKEIKITFQTSNLFSKIWLHGISGFILFPWTALNCWEAKLPRHSFWEWLVSLLGHRFDTEMNNKFEIKLEIVKYVSNCAFGYN